MERTIEAPGEGTTFDSKTPISGPRLLSVDFGIADQVAEPQPAESRRILAATGADAAGTPGAWIEDGWVKPPKDTKNLVSFK